MSWQGEVGPRATFADFSTVSLRSGRGSDFAPAPGSDHFTKEKSVSFLTTQPEQLEIFVSTLSAGGESYAAAKAANAVAAG
jgi:hypothetical protein